MKDLFVEQAVDKVGQEVDLYGWVDSVRNHKKIIFLDLRDRTGIVQMVGDEKLKDISPEDVVYIKGLVKKRPEKLVNPKIKTGTVEVEVKEFKVLGKSKTLPLPINTDGYEIDEEIRQKYRYLDLRRTRLTRNIIVKSKFIQLVREFLFAKNFIEIETPILTESTPEGARDFLVPSRLQPGKFYALPQSPQQYKQLLMVAGFERYFQIARCFRDEDPRADRAYGEFSQIDMEMDFVERKDVMAITEEMIIYAFEKLGAKIKQKPFPVFTYQEAIKKFGADKFDLRTDEEKRQNVQAFAWVIDFPFFEKTAEGGWTFTHNPFSAPLPPYKDQLLKKENIGEILTSQYDLVCNGYEVGGGSIRSHEPAVLETVFEIMGYAKDEIREQFGHMLEAFSYGAPPHGGIAPGIDRLITCLTGEKSLREVIPFPMTAGGKTAVMNAPTEATPEQLKELGINVVRHSGDPPAGGDSRIDVSVFEKIKQLLDADKINYQSYKHKPVFTSEEAAKIRNTDLKQGAKALVMFADKKPIMVVLPANLKVDMKKFKAANEIKDLRMATPEEVKQVTGVEIGAVPPFGNLFSIPLYVDKKLAENEQIVFNAGSHTQSIILKYKDYEKVAHPVIGEFSVQP